MLSVAKLTPGQESYYEQSVAAGLDDYYAGRGESPGLWVGHGALELELDGMVTEGQLGRLIGGRDPSTAAVLRSHSPKRQITVERIETATGRRWLERKTLAPIAGFDLVFSVPKSVSLLHALGDEQKSNGVESRPIPAAQSASQRSEGSARYIRSVPNRSSAYAPNCSSATCAATPSSSRCSPTPACGRARRLRSPGATSASGRSSSSVRSPSAS